MLLALPDRNASPIGRNDSRSHRWIGALGRSLVNAVQDSADIRFVVAHTRTRAKAEEFCQSKSVPLVDSFDAILADPNVDAVVLATPHSQHEEQIKRAAAAGKHIHVEKPITLDFPTAKSAVEATRRAGVMLRSASAGAFIPRSAKCGSGCMTAV